MQLGNANSENRPIIAHLNALMALTYKQLISQTPNIQLLAAPISHIGL